MKVLEHVPDGGDDGGGGVCGFQVEEKEKAKGVTV